MKRTRTVSESIAKTFLFFAFACISTVWAAEGDSPLKVPYLDEKGETQYCENPIHLTDDVHNLNELNKPDCFVVTGKVQLKRALDYNGSVNLILADGADLSIETGKDEKAAIDVNGNLNIYVQSVGEQMGKLSITAEQRGFYINGVITINGGNITATAEEHFSYSVDFVINGGNITTTTGWNGITATRDVTINGGNLIVRVRDDAIHSDWSIAINSGNTIIINGGNIITETAEGLIARDSVIINDGNISATGKAGINAGGYLIMNNGNITAECENYGLLASEKILIRGGSVIAINGKYDSMRAKRIILGYNSANDSIKVDNYFSEKEFCTVDNQAFKDEDGNIYRGTLDAYHLAGKTLKPACLFSSCDENNGFKPITAHNPKIAYANGLLTIIVPRATNVKVEIFDLMGNLVKKSFGNTETHAVSLNHLKRGAYVARVTANHAVRALRFQVN